MTADFGNFDEVVEGGESDEGVARVNKVIAHPEENIFRRNAASFSTFSITLFLSYIFITQTIL